MQVDLLFRGLSDTVSDDNNTASLASNGGAASASGAGSTQARRRSPSVVASAAAAAAFDASGGTEMANMASGGPSEAEPVPAALARGAARAECRPARARKPSVRLNHTPAVKKVAGAGGARRGRPARVRSAPAAVAKAVAKAVADAASPRPAPADASTSPIDAYPAPPSPLGTFTLAGPGFELRAAPGFLTLYAALPPGSPLPTVRVAPRFVFVVRAPWCAVAVALPAAVDPAHARAQTSPGGGRVRVRLPLAEA